MIFRILISVYLATFYYKEMFLRILISVASATFNLIWQFFLRFCQVCCHILKFVLSFEITETLVAQND